AQELQQAGAKVDELTRVTGSQSGSAELIRAKSEMDAAKVKAPGLAAVYQSVVPNAKANPASTLVTMVAGAVTATSDRRSKLELLAFIGLLAGLVLGAVAATMYD